MLYSFNRKVPKENPLKFELNEEENIEKPCIISAYNPVDDFNKLLEDGIDSKIGKITNYYFLYFIAIIKYLFKDFYVN